MQPPIAAYLRVYEPLAAFDDEQAEFWRRYAENGPQVSVEDGPAVQRAAMYSTVGIGWDSFPDIAPHAYVIEGQHGPLICPWRIRLRSAAAVRSWPDRLGEQLVGAYTSESLLAEARGKVLYRRSPRWHEHIALWRVPVRWFACVDLDERELSADPAGLRYRVPMARARRRTTNAMEILKKSLGQGNPLTVSMRHQSEWLTGFHSRALVEIDYGGLAETLTAAQLAADDSPKLLGDALAALARGDAGAASSRYERLLQRWRLVRIHERDN
ncbi:hypothetical protein [Stackebrandtia soli]|uniref:hypothetical protein n=1 Tax=Stackebrandtia soli TaxID=1892856 RepID=UPI0039E87403